MATVTLQAYLAQVESLLAEEQYGRVITHCQHALRTYPRCVDFYRMMGQACLETGRPDDAADMFRRVLGVDPQDFTARVGLGVVAEGISAYDEAAWQWERALELEPNRIAIRQELQRLRERTGEAGPAARIKPTRTALGYIYMRDAHYDRAASEFRAVLHADVNGSASDHERVDVQVALAEALYRAGHRREAAELCLQVLKVLPNALKPNLILGSIYHETGRDEEASPLVESARLLDPTERLWAHLLESPLPPAPGELTLDLPASGPLPPHAGPTAPVPPAVEAAVGAEGASVAPIALEEASPDLPDWLRALRSQSPGEPGALSGTAIAEPEEPEWLKALRSGAPEDLAALTRTGSDEAPAVESALPDWLIALHPETPVQAPGAQEPSSTELPAWLIEPPAAPSPAEEPAETAPPAAPVQEAPPPTASVTEPPVVAEAPRPAAPPAGDEQEVPGWLEALREGQPAGDVSLAAEAPEAPAPPVAAESEPAPLAAPAPAASPREPRLYLDDATAPPSIEAQAAPTGEGEHRARLELARMLVDLDRDEALDQYALLAGASPAIVQEALADLAAMGDAPRVNELRRRLQGEAAAPAPLVDAELAQMVAEEPPAPAPGEPIVAEETLEPPAALKAEPEPPVLPVVDESILPAAPPVEAHPAARGEAEQRALLDLARALKFIDIDEALDTYARLAGAGEPVLAEAIKDLAKLSAASPRAQQLLDAFRGVTPPVPGWVGEAQASGAPAPPAAAAEPVVEADTLPPGAPSGVEEAQPALPIVDEEMLTETAAPLAVSPAAPREPLAYLDDAAAPPSVESQAAPTGAEEHAARLELARTLGAFDPQASLAQYRVLVEADSPLLAQTIDDLRALQAPTREARLLLADALTRAGRLAEAIALYRQMV